MNGSLRRCGGVGLLVGLMLLCAMVDDTEAGIFRRRVRIRQQTVSQCGQQTTTTTIRAGYGAEITVGLTGGGGDVVAIVNRHRARFGLRPVVHVNLGAQAQAQQQHSSGSMHHSPFAGRENVVAGQSSAEQVVNDWMASPGHRANILASDATQIDVGYSGGFWSMRLR